MATKKKFTLVRTQSAGVHFGIVTSRKGQEVTLTSARRIWHWKGANTLHEIALHGVSSESKISECVSSITLTQAIELITMSDKSVKKFASQGWGE